MDAREEDTGHPCNRIPAELCDGSRIIWDDNRNQVRVPARTSRAFCEPCRSRIIACLEELPPAYGRLAKALGDPPKTGISSVRAPYGPKLQIRADLDALMRVHTSDLRRASSPPSGHRTARNCRSAPTSTPSCGSPPSSCTDGKRESGVPGCSSPPALPPTSSPRNRWGKRRPRCALTSTCCWPCSPAG